MTINPAVNFVTCHGSIDSERSNVIRCITIKVLEGIVSTSSLGVRDPDPFCVIKLGGAFVAKTSVCLRTASPSWNEAFVFRQGDFFFFFLSMNPETLKPLLKQTNNVMQRDPQLDPRR